MYGERTTLTLNPSSLTLPPVGHEKEDHDEKQKEKEWWEMHDRFDPAAGFEGRAHWSCGPDAAAQVKITEAPMHSLYPVAHMQPLF